MPKVNIKEVERRIGYRFRNKDLLRQAFLRRSYTRNRRMECNETMEFIGDSILYVVVTRFLTDRYGYLKSEEGPLAPGERDELCFRRGMDEGDFTLLRQGLIERDYLSRCVDREGFVKYLSLGGRELKNRAELETKLKADLFEAILGAVTVDAEWDQEIVGPVTLRMLDIESYLKERTRPI